MKIPFAFSSLLLATLVLLPSSLRSSAADGPDKSYFNVRNYGATGDGKNLDQSRD